MNLEEIVELLLADTQKIATDYAASRPLYSLKFNIMPMLNVVLIVVYSGGSIWQHIPENSHQTGHQPGPLNQKLCCLRYDVSRSHRPTSLYEQKNPYFA